MTTPYLVLARKYRPQKFSDLTGQEHVVRTLVNALKSGRVAHAFLFTGPRGCGKTTSARILARALNCQAQGGPNPEPCGVCTPCLEIAAGTDVDVQEIDAASNNGVDDVRALREAARYLPARDRYKIYIVDEVHMLSSAAFNALLKTLEEPPGHIKFLLATTDPQKLPATILSRVQRQNIQLVPLGKIVTRLREISQAEGVAVSDGALSLVARQAQGSMRDALSLLDQLFSAHDPTSPEIGDAEAAETLGALDRSVVAETVAAVLRRDAAGALTGIVRAYEAGADFKRLAEELAAQARNLVLAGLTGAGGGFRQAADLPDHELRALAQEAAQHDPAQLARVFELLQLAQDEVAKAASPRHALEVALLRAVHLSPAGALPELVARVEQLALRLGAGAGPGSGGGGGGSQPGGAKSGEPARKPPGAPWGSRTLGEGAPFRSSAREDQGSAPAPAAPAPAASAAPASALDAVAAPAPAAPSSAPAMTAQPARAGSSTAGQSAPTVPPMEQSATRAEPARLAAPPPEPEPAPSIPLAANPAAPLDQRWRVLLEAVRAARKMAAASLLEHAVPVSIGPPGVVVGFRKGDALAGLLSDKDTRAAVEAAFEKALGYRAPLQLTELAASAAPAAVNGAASAAGGSLAEQRQTARAKARSQRVAMGREHPAVRAALEVLGGEIEDVKDLGEE